jgi:hypothetical protein
MTVFDRSSTDGFTSGRPRTGIDPKFRQIRLEKHGGQLFDVQ